MDANVGFVGKRTVINGVKIYYALMPDRFFGIKLVRQVRRFVGRPELYAHTVFRRMKELYGNQIECVDPHKSIYRKRSARPDYGFDKDVLWRMRQELNDGEPGKRYPIIDEHGSTIQWTGSPSTYPMWFKDQGLKAKVIRRMIEKALNGECLTEHQETLLKDLYACAKRDYEDVQTEQGEIA